MNLRKYYKDCPIPVREVNVEKWIKRYSRKVKNLKSLIDDFTIAGLYLGFTKEEQDKTNLPPHLILLDNTKQESRARRLAVFYHEWGHHVCAVSNCRCDRESNESTPLAEHHADLFAIHKALDLQDAPTLKQTMYSVVNYVYVEQDKPDLYTESTHLTIHHPTWLEAEKYLHLKTQIEKGTPKWFDRMAELLS